MSRNIFILPIRTLSSVRPLNSQRICRRCLATQQTESTSSASPIPPQVPAQSTQGEATPTPTSSNPKAHDGEDDHLARKTRFFLQEKLRHLIPTAHLQHSTSDLLHESEKQQREKAAPHKKIIGVVVSAGKMTKTVKVRTATQTWNKKIGKNYRSHVNHLVHDPNSSLNEGDVVELHRLKVSKTVGHVVASIVSPFGAPIADRPPIPTPDERLAAYKEKRFAKLRRRKLAVKASHGDDAAKELLERIRKPAAKGTKPVMGGHDPVQDKVGKTRNPGAGAIKGQKGQKLPEGVLPGGRHAVGKIDARAKHNKEKAMKLDAKAEENLLEAKEKSEHLERKGLSSDSALR